jgi:hypothetical protein
MAPAAEMTTGAFRVTGFGRLNLTGASLPECAKEPDQPLTRQCAMRRLPSRARGTKLTVSGGRASGAFFFFNSLNLAAAARD